jgi:cephalosporin hydroxylase
MRGPLPADVATIAASAALYDERGCWTRSTFLGKPVAKSAIDLWTYQEVLSELKTDVLLESGTSGAGSAWFFAHLFDLLGHGRVITVDVDKYDHLWLAHPRITYIHGDVLDHVCFRFIESELMRARDRIGFRPLVTLVSLDAAHTYEHVSRELELYAPLVSVDSWCVVEDVGVGPLNPSREGPGAAVLEFLETHPEFSLDDAPVDRHLTSAFKWLRRVA